MQKLAKFIIGFSIVIVILCFVLLGLVSYIKPINNLLEDLSNIISFLGLLFSAIALLIAALAFQVGTLRPKLRLELEIEPWQGEINNFALPFNTETNLIDGSRPYTEWHLKIFNDGNATARYPVVQFFFMVLFLKNILS